MANEVNAAGSPAATDFLRLQDAALRPQFASADQQLGASEAAQGLAGSGAGRNIGGNVAASQASTLAGVAAPLYQSALNAYSGINASAPAGDEQAYQGAIDQFMQAIQSGASAFGGGFGAGSSATSGTSGTSAPGTMNPYSDSTPGEYAPAGGY
jgi:trimeric autotransporter adhesin